jgi:hypothetical protein
MMEKLGTEHSYDMKQLVNRISLPLCHFAHCEKGPGSRTEFLKCGL